MYVRVCVYLCVLACALCALFACMCLLYSVLFPFLLECTHTSIHQCILNLFLPLPPAICRFVAVGRFMAVGGGVSSLCRYVDARAGATAAWLGPLFFILCVTNRTTESMSCRPMRSNLCLFFPTP